MKSIAALSVFVVIIASISLSCKKHHGLCATTYTKPDSIAFKRYDTRDVTPGYGGRYYVLEHNALYAYPIVFVPAGTHLSGQRLSDNQYQIARYLIDHFPLYLLQHPQDTLIGYPGYSGEKVITLTGLSATVRKDWQISTDTTKLPVELRKYIWQAGIIIDQL